MMLLIIFTLYMKVMEIFHISDIIFAEIFFTSDVILEILYILEVILLLYSTFV